MPELPEVETTRRGIGPHLAGRRIAGVVVRERRLRWPLPAGLERRLTGRRILDVGRRAKYLLLETDGGTLMIHLGMSGSLRIVRPEVPAAKHDHVDIALENGAVLRFRDPRRFGSMHWLTGDPADHPLLAGLGPEPLSGAFSADYLYKLSRKRSAPVKSFIMDSRVVVGVGNIYANEALFSAGIHPRRKAGRLSRAGYARLVQAIREVLERAVGEGGTTLRDFVGSDGNPGYFRQSLAVYGRGGEACPRCDGVLREIRLAQRSTVYCTACQH